METVLPKTKDILRFNIVRHLVLSLLAAKTKMRKMSNRAPVI